MGMIFLTISTSGLIFVSLTEFPPVIKQKTGLFNFDLLSIKLIYFSDALFY